MSSFLFCFSEKKDFLRFTILIYRYNRSAAACLVKTINVSNIFDTTVSIGVSATKRVRATSKGRPGVSSGAFARREKKRRKGASFSLGSCQYAILDYT